MKRITLESAREKMVLAAPAEDFQGRVILPAGATLGAPELQKLRNWGVKEIRITSDQPDSRLGISLAQAGSVQQRLARLERMFEHLHDDPIMEALYQAEAAVLRARLQENA